MPNRNCENKHTLDKSFLRRRTSSELSKIEHENERLREQLEWLVSDIEEHLLRVQFYWKDDRTFAVKQASGVIFRHLKEAADVYKRVFKVIKMRKTT